MTFLKISRRFWICHDPWNLWSPPDLVVLRRLQAECIEKQYSDYMLEQISMKINGRSTKGENIADNGGLKQAYKWVVPLENKSSFERERYCFCAEVLPSPSGVHSSGLDYDYSSKHNFPHLCIQCNNSGPTKNTSSHIVLLLDYLGWT